MLRPERWLDGLRDDPRAVRTCHRSLNRRFGTGNRDGADTQIRTEDLLFTKQLLYH